MSYLAENRDKTYTICEYILKEMGTLTTYFALMIAAWGMQLRPRLYLPMGELELTLQMANLTWAFIEANLYTQFTMLILLLPSKVFTTQRQRNYKWVFVMPYILQYMTCFWRTTQNVKELLTSPPMFLLEDYALAHLKMSLVFGLQLLALIEIVFILFYNLNKEPQQIAD
ncbi:uncharacterized protein LOC122617791 [Drosophila teissieri]|uniref:uncharacterized protein LOC122617791 n=1 Tax=Drosophila teissieri TaxID=7243 RepID=UPI001CBA4B69|nr:uncharacterized protein LOC122617791 [Drosophila teissieri]